MKILVLGVSASGKTTFARRLGEILSIKTVFMDEIMWLPGWQYIGDNATVEKIKELTVNKDWILEGYICNLVRCEVFEKADKIFFLDYPGYISAWRYIKRSWINRVNPRTELPGCPDSFDFKTLWHIYTKTETKEVENLLFKFNLRNKLIHFNKPEEADGYLKNYATN